MFQLRCYLLNKIVSDTRFKIGPLPFPSQPYFQNEKKKKKEEEEKKRKREQLIGINHSDYFRDNNKSFRIRLTTRKRDATVTPVKSASRSSFC